VLDGRLADADPHLSQPLADGIDPLVLAHDGERLGDGLIERLGGHFNGVIDAGEIPAGDLAGSQRHEKRVSYFALYSPAQNSTANIAKGGTARLYHGKHFVTLQ